MTHSRPDAPGSHVVGIDLLRFLAAVLVASLHLWASGASGYADHLARVLPGSNELSHHVMPPFAFVGSIGVQIFFTISGFVISYSAQETDGLYDFLYRRTMRLVPGLWICTFFAVSIALLTNYYPPLEGLVRIARSLILFPMGPKVDDVVWTLNLEVVFYCYIAVFIFLNATEKLPLLALGLAFVSLVYWSSYFSFGCSPFGIEEGACQLFKNGISYKLSSILLVQHGGFFATGIFLFTFTKVGFNATNLAGLILSSCACILQLVWTSKYYFWQDGVIWEPLVWGLATLFMAASIVYNEEINRIFRFRFIRSLGLATYPLYLCHNFIGGSVIAVMGKLGVDGFSAFAVALIFTTGVALWISARVEPAFRDALNEKALDFRIFPARSARLGVTQG